MSDDVATAARELHDRACSEGCPYGVYGSGVEWLRWGERIVSGEMTMDEAVRFINPTRADESRAVGRPATRQETP